MDTARPARQFIAIDFCDLDDPAWMALLRSTATVTYLLLRRHVWRSTQEHPYGLHEYYSRGELACSLSRERLARGVGGVSTRQISRDIRILLERGLLRSVCTGRGNIYLLGHWHTDPATGAYRERYYLDDLRDGPAAPEPRPPARATPACERPVDNLSPTPAPAGRISPSGRDSAPIPGAHGASGGAAGPRWQDRCGAPAVTDPAPNNRERNREKNRGEGISKSAGPRYEGDDITDREAGGEGEILESGELECLIEACSRQFGDLEHLESNLTRAFNLWARTSLDEAGILAATRRAREKTLERISLSAVHDRSKRMPYFFALLEDVLGLRRQEKRKKNTNADG